MNNNENSTIQKEPSPTTAGARDVSQFHSQQSSVDSSNVKNEAQNPLRAVATELAEEFSIKPLIAPAVNDAQEQIQTVALQMDGVRTQISQIKGQIPGLSQQTQTLVDSADALDQMYRQIDDLAILVEMVSAAVQGVNGKVEEAERELSSAALQPLQAVFETLKMGPKGFRSLQ